MWHDVEKLNMNQYLSQSDEGQTLWSDMCRHVPGCLTVWKHDITWFPSQLPAADLLTVTNTCAHVPTRMTPIIDWQKSAVRVRGAFSVTRAPPPATTSPPLPDGRSHRKWLQEREKLALRDFISRGCSGRSHEMREMDHVLEGHSFEFVCVWVWVTPPWL